MVVRMSRGCLHSRACVTVDRRDEAVYEKMKRFGCAFTDQTALQDFAGGSADVLSHYERRN